MIILLLANIATVILAFNLALLLRYSGIINVHWNQHTAYIFVVLSALLIFYLGNLFSRYNYVERLRLFFNIIKVWLTIVLFYLIVGFLTKYYFLIDSRGFLILYFFLLFHFMALFHLLLIPRLLGMYYAHPAKKILCGFIGPEKHKNNFEEFIQKYSFLGLSFTSTLEKKESQEEPQEYFMFSDTKVFSTLYKQIKSAQRKSKPLHVGSKLFDELNLKWEWARVKSIPIYTFYKSDYHYLYKLVKRFIDIVGAVLLMIILSPLFLIIALAVKLDSPGPVIYKQKRCGRSGKRFIFYKFRSMVSSEDNESTRELEFKKYLEIRTNKGKILSSKDITTVGSILRKASIDELPQLWNVLRGDMSLVGPRPPIPYEVKYYKDWHKDRLSVKQGLTGLWQIYGRGEMPSDKSIFLDMLYVVNQSLTVDLNLIFQTIPAVILGKGAY